MLRRLDHKCPAMQMLIKKRNTEQNPSNPVVSFGVGFGIFCFFFAVFFADFFADSLGRFLAPFFAGSLDGFFAVVFLVDFNLNDFESKGIVSLGSRRMSKYKPSKRISSLDAAENMKFLIISLRAAYFEILLFVRLTIFFLAKHFTSHRERNFGCNSV